MKVAHLIWELNVGGAETMLVDIVREQALSAQVYVVVINSGYHDSVLRPLKEKATIVHINRPASSRNPWHVLKLNHVLHQINPDIIHTHGERIIDMILFRNTPTVNTIHSTGVTFTNSIRKYRGLFAISNAVKRDVVSRYPGLDIAVIHNGIAFSAIRAKRRYGNVPFRVIQVGRLDHSLKGQDIVINALGVIAHQIGDGAVTADFIGEGPSRKFLEKLTVEAGVGQWCTFLGSCSRQDIYSMLPEYDLLVQPSRHEGFGLTIVEAIAARMPVLVSNVEGPMEVIDEGKYGFFFESGDFHDCANKIIQIMGLSGEQEMEKRMSDAYNYAKSRFDINVTAREYLEEYRKFIICSNGN